jgi:hypothetical protein
MTDEKKEDLRKHYQEAKIIFTDHAITRARKRFGFHKATTKRLTAEATANGEFYIHNQVRENDTPSYVFIYQDKVFVIGGSLNKFTGQYTAILKTIYPRGKNTEKDKNYKHFVQGKPRITLGVGKRVSNARAEATARKEKKHKKF